MEVETKQLYFFIILTALSLKINASPATEDGIDTPPMNTTLGVAVSVDRYPNIIYTTHGKKYLVLNPHNFRFCWIKNWNRDIHWTYSLMRKKSDSTMILAILQPFLVIFCQFYISMFQKTKVLTVILRCLTCLNLNSIKNYT